MKKMFLIIIGVCVMWVNCSVLVYAADDDPIKVMDCMAELDPIFLAQTNSFFEFLEEHFANDAGNSSLLNTALASYRGYEKRIRATFDRVDFAQESTSEDVASQVSYEELLASYTLCSELKDEYISSAKSMMILKVKLSNSEKKAMMVVEKYKAINEKLNAMSVKVSFLYSYFKTFENKLPGYLTDCFKSS